MKVSDKKNSLFYCDSNISEIIEKNFVADNMVISERRKWYQQSKCKDRDWKETPIISDS